jgi:hypothetical protein
MPGKAMLMNKEDNINSILREWKAPEPSRELDGRVLQAFHAARSIPVWNRVSPQSLRVQVLLIAATLLVTVALVALFRYGKESAGIPGIVTQINGSGFQALPNGAATITKSKEIKD